MAAPKDGDQQGSLDALQKELEANPFNTSLLSKLAETYANRGDYNNACQLYEKLVRLDEDNGRAWTALGHCYLLKAEYQKCFTAYQKALYTLPHTRDPQLWYGIALLYNKFDTYEYAEPAYQAVLRIDPAFEQKNEVFFKLGQIYKKTAAYDNAISYLRNSMVGDAVPLNRKVDALCSIGVCYEKQGKLSNAIEIYREALELERGNFKTMEYLGWALAQHSKEEEAVEQMLKALEAVGNSSAEEGDIHYLLGRCYLLQKKYPEGQTEFQKAIFKNPNSYIYWCSIGVLYAKASQPQDAFECFIKASNITQEESESWFNMGILYEHCNQSLEAVLAYQRAVTIDPKNTEAAKRKEELQERTRGAPPDYIHPKFEISDLPFSLQKSEKAKKTSQLPGIDQHKPGELAALQPDMTPTAVSPTTAPQPSVTVSPAPVRQSPRASSSTTVSIPHVAAGQTQSGSAPAPQRPPIEVAPKPEVFPGFSFSQDPTPAPAPHPPAAPSEIPLSSSQGNYSLSTSAFPSGMGMIANQFSSQLMSKPGVMSNTGQSPMPAQYQSPSSVMPPATMNLQGLNPAGMTQGGMSQAAMSQGGMNPGGMTQAGMSSGGMTQVGMSPGTMGQGGMGQGGMGQGGMGQGGMGQGGMGQGGMGQGGMGQGGMGQAGMGQAGMGQAGMGQTGMGQAGMNPGVMAQGGMGQGMNQGMNPQANMTSQMAAMQAAMQAAMSANPALNPAMMSQAMGLSQNPLSSGMSPTQLSSSMPPNPMAAGMPQQVMNPGASMPTGMPQQGMAQGGMNPQNAGMGNGFMGAGGPQSQGSFNPMSGFPGMMNPMGMNPFAGMNPVMMGQMMQMMYLQQMAMMRSMFGMGRGGPSPPKPDSQEQQNSTNSGGESVETAARGSSQKRKGDNLPDTRTKKRG